ncbi:MAG: GGDEF domain-containing protein [Terracidiphilus sp.]
MNRLLPAIAIIAGWASIAWGAPPVALTTLSQIEALSNGESNKGYPVTFEATVTFFRGDERILFVQDQGAAIFVLSPADAMQIQLRPGDRIRIQGKTVGSFNPMVDSNNIAVLHHGDLPTAIPASFKQLIKGKFDCRLVSVRGIIRSADLAPKHSWIRESVSEIQFQTKSGPISVHLDTDDLDTLRGFLDATVEITGVSAGKFDDKMQLTGTELFVPSLASIKVIARSKTSPWLAPVTSMDKILSVYDKLDLTPRIRVSGIITYYQPGHAIVLQDGSKSLWITTNSSDPLRIGDRAEAIGFSDAHDRFLSLIDAEVQDSHVYAPVAPQQATWLQLAHWSNNTADGHQNDLVSIEGKVVEAVREATQDEFVLNADGELFTAIYHHPPTISEVPRMMEIPLGTRIRLTGICTRTETKSVIAGAEVPFNILLRSFDDITIIARPSLLNIRNLLLALGLSQIVVFVVIARGWALERKVRRQAVAMSTRTESEAELERQRSRILEAINESKPLPEILVQIAAMVSSALEGAPCWCETADGERLGDCPPMQECRLRIVRTSINARVGQALGTLFAGLNPETPPADREVVALSNGARLATLAIETLRLYSDLRRRSEYDLLTDIPNRFTLETFTKLKIEEARQSGSMLGLIYIDLDKFKMINDTYGHHVGDLFLKEAALRMDRQLLGGDMLARLGGDEFAALVSLQNGISDLDKIVIRLEHCFDHPFAVEGYLLNGGASIGIALYPKDGSTKDSLLSAADAAMYVIKSRKRQSEKCVVQNSSQEPANKNGG